MSMHFFCKKTLSNSSNHQAERFTIVLQYYLIESKFIPEELQQVGIHTDAFPLTTFGICIRKLDPSGTSQSTVEEAIVRDITTDRSAIELMLAIFSRNLVTPCSLKEVVEDSLCSDSFFTKDDCADTEDRCGSRIGA